MTWVFYLFWAAVLPLAIWAVLAQAHYYKTFKPFMGGFRFLSPEQEARRGPLFIRLIGITVLLIMGLQVYLVTSGAMRVERGAAQGPR
jgi:hypothetical protein